MEILQTKKLVTVRARDALECNETLIFYSYVLRVIRVKKNEFPFTNGYSNGNYDVYDLNGNRNIFLRKKNVLIYVFLKNTY